MCIFKKPYNSTVELPTTKIIELKILDKTLRLNLANADKYIEGQSKVKTYLTKYGITASDLAKHYNEIVNQKVLKDWCSIYDSKFLPKNYGDVTVKTEWENW